MKLLHWYNLLLWNEILMELRVLFGSLKGRKICYPKNYEARPTLARTRDVLFNWQQSFKGMRSLDLFAGTGIIGLESLSLGGSHVDFIELSKKNAKTIKNKFSSLPIQGRYGVHEVDAFEWIKKSHTPYDFIFIDPPFDKDLHDKLLSSLLESPCVNDDTLLFVESPSVLDFRFKWEVLKEKKIGKVKIYLIKKLKVENE